MVGPMFEWKCLMCGLATLKYDLVFRQVKMQGLITRFIF